MMGLRATHSFDAFRGFSGGVAPNYGTLASIAVTPTTADITAVQVQQFVATGTYTSGKRRNLTTQVLWESTDPSVAAIVQTGTLTGLTRGSATVSATAGALSDTAAVTVTAFIMIDSAGASYVVPAGMKTVSGSVVLVEAEMLDATGTPQAVV
jgi:hypothetical protein